MVPYNNDIDEQQDRVITGYVTDFHFNLRRQKDSEMQKREPHELWMHQKINHGMHLGLGMPRRDLGCRITPQL